ncbi:hypothetical protein [Hyphomicrobium sp. 802]|uniref:hypothetical protein n=1 Tax=Hyphomicrobium sp. 802 TaxID=1112272 RepID=UPI00045EB118|nr:hypothetical protein [Hyphomicrobium sp. 802]
MKIPETKRKWSSPEIEASFNDLCQRIGELFTEADSPELPPEGRSERISEAFEVTEKLRAEAARLFDRHSWLVAVSEPANGGEKST